jgi:hypothetical protein
MITLTLDVHAYSVLIEAAWGAGTGLRMEIMQRAVNEWFHRLHPKDVATLFHFFSTKMKRYPVAEEEQAHFLGRYDPDNQYLVAAGDVTHHCYRVNDRFYVALNAWVDQDQITKVVKLTAENWKLEANIARDLQVRGKPAPPCPKCRQKSQIQIMDSLARPPVWRCRTCKHVYEQEQGTNQVK